MTSSRAHPTLREIFDEEARYVMRSLLYLGVGESNVEDLCQEVFVVVHRKLPEFEGRSGIRTWLYGICLRVAADHRRRAHVRRERSDSEPAAALSAAPSFEPETRAAARSEVRLLLDALDDDKRAVLVLYEVEGLSMKEVAEVLGCPLQTAYSRLHAARARLLELTRLAREKELP